MSSILTNTGAMTALQTLKSINMNLAKTQNEISTGKSISNARDGAAIWSISKVMESDVKGFQQISNSLSLGQSTIGVARTAAESVTDLLTEIKGLIVSAQEENVDRAKIQTDIGRLRDQVASVVSAAQFNGLNLLSNRETVDPSITTAPTYAQIAANAGSRNVNVLGSLDRTATSVTATNIATTKQDLGQQNAATGALTLAAAALTAAGTATANGAAAATYTINGETTTAGRTAAVMAGDGYAFQMSVFVGSAGTGTGTAVYVARDGDTTSDIARGLSSMINFQLNSQGLQNDFTVTVANNVISVRNNTATALAAAAAANVTLSAGGTAGGGLEILGDIDVSTERGARAGLSAIEGLINSATNAAANLGSAQRRMDIQAEFVAKLTDSFKAGIGTLVDANMEEASARLQALQVQQQLGIQSLSIANQAPQSILALFR